MFGLDTTGFPHLEFQEPYTEAGSCSFSIAIPWVPPAPELLGPQPWAAGPTGSNKKCASGFA